MEYYSLDSLLNNPSLSNQSPNQNTPHNKDNKPGSLEDFLEDKVQCLTDIIEHIQQEIRSREQLSQNIIHQTYEHYCLLKSKLFGLYFWEPGTNPSIDSRKSILERQLDALKQEVRKEQVQCSQDVSILNKEFRTWLKQYCDLMQRVRLVTGDGVRARDGTG